MVISQRVTIQSLSSDLGEHEALRSCLPVAFYMVLSGAGYIAGLSLSQFMQDLDRSTFGTSHVKPGDWSRPALTKYLRQKYKADIVSWQFGWPPPTDFDKMIAAGYVESNQEVEFFNKYAEGRDVANIIRDGYPVIATMKPGFGTPENKNIHAVVLLNWKHGKVTVIDPDERNKGYIFDERRVRQFLAPHGAGSIVLPPQ